MQELNDSLHDNNKGRLFDNCYGAFRSVIERTGIVFPAWLLTHVLYNTLTSHFMMNSGNILVLPRAQGPTDIKMTVRHTRFGTKPAKRRSEIELFG